MSAAAAVVAVVAVCAMAAPAGAVVVDFDDLTGSGIVADGYGGINWNGEWTYYDFYNADQYVPHSPEQRIYPGPATSVSFSFLGEAIFAGAWFNGVDLGGPVFFELYLDDVLVHTSDSLLFPSVVAITTVSTFLESGYAGLVDRVTVRSDGNFWIMDDVTYTAASVPEPASMALLAGGLLGAALMRRRTPRR